MSRDHGSDGAAAENAAADRVAGAAAESVAGAEERGPRPRGAAAPIGVFDSGIGGLTVVRQVLASLPKEDVLYFGDTARVPYGIKSKETVTRFSRENTQFLIRRGIKMLIVACNSASAMALESLRREFELPILGVIHPGAQAAVRATRSGKVGVIGTQATVGSRAYDRAISELDPKVQVHSRPCPLFVPLAEEGWTEGEVPEKVAAEYLAPLLAAGIDTLILGCTHYPLLEVTIQKVAGDGVTLIDTAVETVREVTDLLSARQLHHPEAGSARQVRREYFVSDVPAEFRKVGERFLGHELESLVWVDQDDLPWYER
ncbi:MAG: glutamate racemase [Candidatus Eisenbacteria bacterium]